MRVNEAAKKEELPQDQLLCLLKKIQSGEDSDAFGELCSVYANLLDAAVRKYAPSLGIQQGGTSELLGIGGEELRQDAAMVLYKAALTYDPDDDKKGRAVSFGLYAKICIRNAMISQIRKYNRLKKRTSAAMESGETAAEGTDVPVLTEETLRQIHAELSPYEREILQLRLTGKPPREIAGIIGKTEKSVSNGIYRIKCKIRRIKEQQ